MASVTTLWATAEQMHGRADEWRALARSAAEPNVFAEPDYLLPALRHFGAKGVRFLLAERAGRLVGVLPLCFARARWGVPLTCAIHHLPYAPHGVALVAADDAALVCGALLDALAGMRPAPTALLMPYMPQDGAFAAAWRQAMADRALASAVFDPFLRPVMMPPHRAGERAGYLTRALSGSRRKRIAQQRSRIEQHRGPLEIRTADRPEQIEPALRRFLDLEATGWKGRRGTAIAQDSGLGAFFLESLTALAARGQARIVTLEQPAGTIAAGLLVSAGSSTWFYKTAYDEQLARFSPGVLLDVTVSDLLLADPGVSIADSLLTVADDDFGRLWCERRPMADLLVGLAPGGSTGFRLAVTLEAWRRRGRAAAKAGIQWLRARRGLKN